MRCSKNHRYNNSLKNLSDEQGGPGRHKCPGCAYLQGYADGFNSEPQNFDLNSLPDSQAGTGRHKSAEEAYKLGYDRGRRDSK